MGEIPLIAGQQAMEKTARLKAEQRDDLVAYLDGELPEGDSQQIDHLLARSEVARHEVEALARTWEMLDLLARPNATAGFTDRTLTTLKVSELPTSLSDQPWMQTLRQIGLGLAWTAVLAISAVAGYAVTTRVVPNPDAELLADLPLLRNLDIYLDVQDIEFVNALRSQTDFASNTTDTAANAGASSGRRLATSVVGHVSVATLNARFREAAQLPNSERERILRNQKAFEQLTPERQSQLIELHRQISAEPENMHTLLETYALWLQTLSPGQRDDLRKASNSGARVELVRRFKSEQDANRETQLFDLNIDLRRGFSHRIPFPTLKPEDLAVVMTAIKQEFELYEQQRIDALKTPGEQYVAIIRLLIEPGRTRRVDDSAVQRVIAKIPDEGARRSIQRSAQPEDQRRELFRRITMSTSALLADEMKQFMPTEKDLQELFVSDKISGDTRYELMQMSPRELSMELVRRYLDESDDPRLKQIEALRRQLRETLFMDGAPMFGPRPTGFGGKGPWSGGEGRDRSPENRAERPPGPPPFGNRDRIPLRNGD